MDYCIDCNDGVLKPCIAKRCKAFHYTLHRRKIASSKQKLQTEVRKLIQKDNSIDLPIWYNDKIETISRNPFCSNCGAKIPNVEYVGKLLQPTTKFYHAAAAHIFPKSIFESIAVHPLNYVIAGAGCGCHSLTHRIDTFSKMKIFPVAIERFRIFESEITENHKYLTLFKEAADAYILQQI